MTLLRFELWLTLVLIKTKVMAKYEDSHLNQLYNQHINAKYSYLQYLRETYLPKVAEETQGYVVDTQHWAYPYLFPSKSRSSNDQCKALYKKLALLIHPDKCKDSFAHEIFTLITEDYNCDDLDKLHDLDIFYQDHGSFEFYLKQRLPEKTKEEQIKQWECEVWFQWQQQDSLIRKILISPEELQQREKERSTDVKEL